MNNYRYEGQELDVFSHATHWKKYFGNKLLPYIGRRVVEVGAGIGATTSILCSGNQETWLCIEPDNSLRQQIDKLILTGKLPPFCYTSNAFIKDLNPDQLFDTILYIDVLEHIRDDAVELEDAGCHLVQGGVIIVLSPAHPFLFSPFDRAIGHYRRYNRKSISGITPSRFLVEQLYYLDSVGMMTSLVNRFFLKQAVPSLNQILFWDHYILPISRLMDRLTGYRSGRSIVCVFRKK
jgi:hypothetical protein